MHWGEEYVTDPNESQKKIASYLSSLGVNLIIGNHAHSIQPVQMIGDTLVFYALGNFISAQDTPNKLTGAIAYVKVKLEDNKIKFYDINADLIYTYFKGGRNFKVYPYTKLDNSIMSKIDSTWKELSNNGPWLGDTNTCYETISIEYDKNGIIQKREILILDNNSIVLRINNNDTYYVNATNLINILK